MKIIMTSMALLITYRLVAVCLVVQHGRPLGAVAPGLHGPQPHLVLWETLHTINKTFNTTSLSRWSIEAGDSDLPKRSLIKLH